MKFFTKISFYLFHNRMFSYLVLCAGLIFVSVFIIQSCEESSVREINKENILTPTSKKGKLILSVNSDNEHFAEMDFGDSKFSYFTQKRTKTKTNILKKDGASNALHSSFQIKKGNTIVYYAEFELDTTIRHYRLLQHKKIEEIAKSLNNNLTEKDYEYIVASMNTFIKGLIETNSFNKTSLQSIYFHKAIVSAKKREKQTGVLECTPFPFYITDKSYYCDIKDVSVSKQTVQSVIESNPEIKDDKGVPELKVFLNNYKGDSISFDQIYFLFVDSDRYTQFLDNTPTGTDLSQKSSRVFLNRQGVQNSEGCDCAWWCPLGCGCSWGCCGNYSGCCLYSNPICLIHDAICTCCEPASACFSGCVPDPGC